MCYAQQGGKQVWTGNVKDTLQQLFTGGAPQQSQGNGNSTSSSVTPPPAPAAPAGSAQPATRNPTAPSAVSSGSSDATGFNNLVLPRTGASPVDRSVPTG